MATIFDKLRGTYRVQARCRNCYDIQEISIPKGLRVSDYFKEPSAKCNTCGVNDLELVDTLKGRKPAEEKEGDKKNNNNKKVEKFF